MMNVELTITKKIEDEDANAVYTYCDITADGQVVGDVEVVTDYDQDEEDSIAYIERIDVYEEYRGKGIGTEVITLISNAHAFAVLAPDNERARSLYERLGEDFSSDEVYGYCDQGFGVYRV